MWRQRACLRCSCACLSTSLHRILRILLGCYDLLCSHYCWTECNSAESTNLFSGPYYCIHVRRTCTSRLHLFRFGQFPNNQGPWPQPRCNGILVILKRVITQVQCTNTLNTRDGRISDPAIRIRPDFHYPAKSAPAGLHVSRRIG